MDVPRTKAQVLGRIWADHALLEAMIAPLSAVQMTQPPADGWSVKDVLAHITVWEGLLVEWLTAFHRSFGRVLQAVDALSATVDLETPLAEAWAAGEPLGQLIAENTYEHYHEHMAAIGRWREAARSSA
jgi:hypothetical protein